MKNYLTIFLIVISYEISLAQTVNNVRWVDPNIGGVGLILVPTRPTVQLPNQMIRSYPDRKDYIDAKISGFPLSLISHRNGQLFNIMPFTGQADKNTVSAWDPENEIATPYYYSEWLEDFDTRIEFAPGAKAGFFRITFPGNAEANMVLRIVNKGKWTKVSGTSVEGVETFNGMNAWVYGEFNKEFSFTERNDGDNMNAVISWPANTKNIDFKYAISYISAEQARKNLKNEVAAWDFEKLKTNAKGAWDKVLNQIEVTGGTDARKRTFYTALYRCYERMVDITEDGRYYSNYNGQVNNATRPFYVDDWIWDTYLALHPLRLILNPSLESDMIDSYVKMY